MQGKKKVSRHELSHPWVEKCKCVDNDEVRHIPKKCRAVPISKWVSRWGSAIYKARLIIWNDNCNHGNKLLGNGCLCLLGEMPAGWFNAWKPRRDPFVVLNIPNPFLRIFYNFQDFDPKMILNETFVFNTDILG